MMTKAFWLKPGIYIRSNVTNFIKDSCVGEDAGTNSNNISSVIFAYDSNIGKVRENMEDSTHLDETIGLFIVADGMGGHKGGEVASKIAVDEVSKFLKAKFLCSATTFRSTEQQEKTLKKIFNIALKIANEKILDEAKRKPNLRGMGTTIVFSFIPKDNTNTFYIANVGDSRAYLINGGNQEGAVEEGPGRIKQLTEDHSVAADMVRKHYISEEQAKTSPYKHMLTQHLGRSFNFTSYIKRFEWKEGDYLLLCSDGLTDMLDDNEICYKVLEYQREDKKIIGRENKEVISREEDYYGSKYLLDNVCKVLIQKANEKGGRDNITVILIQNKAIASLLRNG